MNREIGTEDKSCNVLTEYKTATSPMSGLSFQAAGSLTRTKEYIVDRMALKKQR